MKKFIILLSFFFLFKINVYGEELTKYSKSAILIELTTGKVLYEKDSSLEEPPASMTKIMSMILIMDAIDNKKISMNDTVIVSKNASSMGGSQVYLNEGEKYKVSELFKSVAIASANDAVVALAEKVSGTTENFVNEMNKKCKELGCSNTLFKNPHGLDEEGHYSSAKDMALMAKYLLNNHSEVLNYTSEYEDYLERPDGSSTWLVNTNKLVRFYEGIDGLKTGFTEGAGYCLTATASKNNMRLISVVMGVDSIDNRTTDTINLINYGFSNYRLNTIYKKNKVIDNVKIEKGKKESVDIILANDATELTNINDKKKSYKINIKLNNLNAPLLKKDKIGIAKIVDSDNNFITNVDITVKENIYKANLWDYIKRNFNYTLAGKKI